MNNFSLNTRVAPRLLITGPSRDCQQRTARSLVSAEATGDAGAIVSPVSVEVLLSGLKHVGLRQFVQAVLQEPECDRVLNLPMASGGAFVSPPIRRLYAAAFSTMVYPAANRIQSEVIYAATVILGLQNLMQAAARAAEREEGMEIVVDASLANAGQDDVFRSIVRSALYKLEGQAPIHASLLRIALNWGNQDEMQDEESQRMQTIVRQSSRVCAARLQLMKRAHTAAKREVVHG